MPAIFPLSSNVPTAALARLASLFAWAPRALEERAASRQLAALSERERHDFVDALPETAVAAAPDSAADIQALKLARRAWYGRQDLAA